MHRPASASPNRDWPFCLSGHIIISGAAAPPAYLSSPVTTAHSGNSGPPRRARGEREAVLAHLQAILDTRRGESLSAPDLGVLEFADVVHGRPAGAQALAHSIRVAIARHEPRLRGVVVQPVAGGDPLCLAFEISARLAGDDRREPLRARADLSASGCFKVHVP